MTVSGVLARGRARRQLLMRDTGTLTRPAGAPVFNEATGEYESAGDDTTLYAGPADVKPRNVAAAAQDAGERQVVTSGYDIALPWSAALDIRPDDLWTTTASEDAGLVGKVLTVTDVVYGGRRTAHHFTAESRA